jgi:hypothetical protein
VISSPHTAPLPISQPSSDKWEVRIVAMTGDLSSASGDRLERAYSNAVVHFGLRHSSISLQRRTFQLMRRSHGSERYSEVVRKRMGWMFPWASSCRSDFNYEATITRQLLRGQAGQIMIQFSPHAALETAAQH